MKYSILWLGKKVPVEDEHEFYSQSRIESIVEANSLYQAIAMACAKELTNTGMHATELHIQPVQE